MGVGGGFHDAAVFLTAFSQKIAFLGTFWAKFLLQKLFLNGRKSVLMRPQGLRPRAHAPT